MLKTMKKCDIIKISSTSYAKLSFLAPLNVHIVNFPLFLITRRNLWRLKVRRPVCSQEQESIN